ncbi:hypothetical protein ACBR40_14450 [Nonomuraea sp. AD125B]|uniref:hypothetical protein n=1 Tax=Nonomuraea TaxID=83681 RepID=UPI0031DBF110
MGVILPPAAASMMAMLGPWPNIDEDDMGRESAAVRTAHTTALPAAAQVDAGVQGVGQVHKGESATHLQSFWDQHGGQGGHLAQADAALRSMPRVIDGGASVVSAVKVAAGTQAVFAAVDVAKLLAFGGAVGATYATARVLAGRRAVGGILRQGAEGTGKVLAPLMRRKVTEPMRRVLDTMKLPRGPMGSPALAGGPRGVVPMRPAGLRNPSGPRSVRDGIAQMGRRNNRGNSGGGRGGGGGRGRRDETGKFHGAIPQSTRGMSEAEKKKLEDDLKKSIAKRKAEEQRLGYEAGHAERIRREEGALRRLFGRNK